MENEGGREGEREGDRLRWEEVGEREEIELRPKGE